CDLHSFPTRRSSDLLVAVIGWGLATAAAARSGRPVDAPEVIKRAVAHDLHEVITGDILAPTKRSARVFKRAVEQLEHQAGLELRSEEHTSELQSREN